MEKKWEFRSNYNLGSYNDNEKCKRVEGDVVVDSSGYVKTEELVERFLRGEKTAMKVDGNPVYDDAGIDSDDSRQGNRESAEKVLENFDPRRSPGFDLTDGARIVNRGKEILREAPRVKKLSGEVVQAPAAASGGAAAQPSPPRGGTEPASGGQG